MATPSAMPVSNTPRDKQLAVSESPPGPRGPTAWAVAVVLALFIGIVYGRALHAPFIFDDRIAIVENRSLTSLWPLVGTAEHPGPLNPAPDLPISGRPLVNLSLAINYHFGALNPVGYHAVNIVLHFASALLLWAIVQRTLLLPYFAGRFETSAKWLALAVAMLWALHPLQTETVIYSTQRTELMMAFFYLAMLYCSLRYWAALPLGPSEDRYAWPRPAWLVLAVLSCLAGMASKEVMVSAPLMVLLFERTFIAGSLTAALRRSWPLYLGLASALMLLLVLNMGAPRGETAGFGGKQQPAIIWWLTQCKVLLMYFRLIVWPSPLLIHYQLPYISTFTQAWMYVVPVLLMAIVTLALLWRNDPAGYLGTWFFAILAPTFVVPIGTEIAAERRMYLPMAALVVLLVVGGYGLMRSIPARKHGQRLLFGLTLPGVATALPLSLVALVFGLVSANRCTAYDDEKFLWEQVTRYQPSNILAHSNLGRLLIKADRYEEAIEQLRQAIQLDPQRADLYNSLGNACVSVNRLPEAVDAFHASLAREPDDPVVMSNLGLALKRMGRDREAIELLEQAVRQKPDEAGAHDNLAIALAGIGKIPPAIEHFREAIRLGKSDEQIHNNLGILLVMTGKIEEAIAQFDEAARLRPDRADIQHNLADALCQAGKPEQAIEHYRAALRLKPDYITAYANLAQALIAAGRPQEANQMAERGIEIGRSTGQNTDADKIEEWLKRYRTELRRVRDDAPSSQLPPSAQ